MNITLAYQKSNFKVDVMDDTPCQYLFNIVNKIFHIPISQIRLKYEDIEIKNNSRLLFSVMGKTDRDNITGDETIIVEKRNNFIKQKSLMNVNSRSLRNTNLLFNYLEESTIKLPSIKNKKKGAHLLRCQICNTKNSIFYCRVCNLFVCFECNVRFNEHKNHERINLEDGDTFLGCDVYREEIINQLNVIEIGYQQTLEWMIDSQEREKFLQTLFKSLEYIRNHSLNLAEIKTLYSLDQEIISDFRLELDKIPKPKLHEEIIEIFGSLNLKENELRNYTKFLNLQIIKAEYNKILLKCLDVVKKQLDQLDAEVKSKLNECEEIKFRNIEDIKLYIKESKLEKNRIDINNYLSKNNNTNDKYNQNNNSIYMNQRNVSSKFKNTINNSFKKKKKNNFFKEVNKTVDKKIQPFGLMEDIENLKKKYKIKELNLTNIFGSSNINNNKKRELLIPLKIMKKKVIRNAFLNDINCIEKPKDYKKKFQTNQELSEADFKDFPFGLENKENNNNDKKEETPSNYESDNNNLIINPENQVDTALKKNLILKDIDLEKLTGSERKIIFNAPPKTKETSYGRNILGRRKAIFENKD